MATPKVIRIKRSAVQGKIPTTGQLVLGELALNTYDGRLFTIKNDGTTSSVTQVGADRFTGDVTGAGNGSVTLTLANTAVAAGSYGSASEVTTFTVDSKGRLTSASNVPIAFPVTSVAGKNGAITLGVGDIAGAASIASPNFTGIPQADTAAPGTSTRQLATTAFVMSSISAFTAGVSSFNGRTNAVVLTLNDVTDALGYTPINITRLGAANGVATLNASGKLSDSQLPESLQGAMIYQGVWDASANVPTLTTGAGTKGWYFKVSVAGTTMLDGNNVWNIGDSVIFNGTAWERLIGSHSDVTSVAGRVGAILLTVADVDGAAPSNSPTFTGVPLSTTAPQNTNTKQIATTEFVLTQAANTIPLTNGTGTIGTSTLFARADHVHPTDATRAALSSPDFQGTPLAPTAAPGTNTRQIATTAFVSAAVSNVNVGVTTFNTRSGAIVLSSDDVKNALGFTPYNSTNPAGYAPTNNPTFTGIATLPTGSKIPGAIVNTNAGISAAGTTQATATALTSDFNTVTFASGGQGVVLPSTAAGKTVLVNNISISPINVYPPVGSAIDDLGTNTPLQLASGAAVQFFAISGSIWSSTTKSQIQANSVIGSVANSVNSDTASYALDSAKLGGALSSAYALLLSPDFSGVPLAPTAAAGTNTRQIATTAFVLGQLSNVVPLTNGTGTIGTSTLFARADHVHPTDASKAPTANPTFSGVVNASNIAIASGVGNSISFWGNNTTYRIAMGNAAEYQYGTVTDYSIKFFMGGAAGRGFVFGSDGNTPVAAINSITGDAKFAGTVTATTFAGTLNGTASASSSVASIDNRNTADTPTSRNMGVYFDFKANTVDGLGDGGTYHGVMTWRPWGSGTDISGGVIGQIGMTSGSIWRRTSASISTWNSWIKMWDTSNLTNLNQLTNGPGYITAAGTVANSTNVNITDDVSSSATMYPVWVDASGVYNSLKTTTSKLSYVPSTGTLKTLSVVSPYVLINTNGSPGAGISWYSDAFNAWIDYMANPGANKGPKSNITAPTGSLVTSWARRSFIENVSGYGWTFESGASASTTPTVVAEISSVDGSAKFNGVVTAPTFSGAVQVGTNYLYMNTTTWTKTNGETNVLGSLRAAAATGDARFMIYSDAGKANVYVDGSIYVNDGANKVYNTADVIGIANGGTGATTAAAALASLGAMPAAGGTMTGTLLLASSAPVISLKDTDSTGSAQLGYVNFLDSTGTQTAYIGYGSSGNTNFYINNALGPVVIEGSSNLQVSSTNASSSPTTGALTVGGGVGIGGDLNVGGIVSTDAIIITDTSGVPKFKLVYNPTTDSLETIKL